LKIPDQRSWVDRVGELLESTEYGSVIDLGIGQPDGGPPEVVSSVLKAGGAELSRYPESVGSPGLREAISDWVRETYGVRFEPSEVAACHGAKLAVALAPMAFGQNHAPIVVPTPGYPTYCDAVLQSGGTVRWLRLTPEQGFEPTRADLRAAFDGAPMAYLNYPSNPTGAAGSPALFERAVEVATQTGTVIVHDAAYAALRHDGKPLSIFQVAGAADVAVEVHSFSKAFHMAGWRIGFVLARRALFDRLIAVLKRNDTGPSRLSQAIAESVLRHDPDFARARHERDRSRTHQVATMLCRLGCRVERPGAGFYVWFRPPEGKGEALGWEAIVKRAGVACAPGDAFGPEGAGWVRFSCVLPKAGYDEVFERLRRIW
jgi:LL-diaminopimelate aminotransferase